MSESDALSPQDGHHLRQSIALAARAREGGNHPFGALVLAADGRVVEGLNTVVTEHDPTGHAETNAVRNASRVLTTDELRASTLYTSTEPCAMCAGAIYWAGIPRVVYALSEAGLRAMVPEQGGEPTMDLPCREVFARGGRAVDVAGPALEAEAAAVHDGFWG
jgi:tRNA(Arg) A34 adenosine deaminase TadA